MQARQGDGGQARGISDLGAVGRLEMVQGEFDNFLVEVVTAQMVVTVAGEHFHYIAFQVDQRYVEGAAAQVVHQRFARTLMTGFIGQRGGGGFVEDAHDLQPGDFTGFAGRLALHVGKIGRHGNDRLVDRLPQVILGDLLQPAQDHGGDFRRAVVLVAQGDAAGFAHAPLDRTHSAFRAQNILIAGGFADQQAAVVGQADHRGQNAHPLGDGDDFHTPVTHHGNFGVGGTQIDTDDDFTHV